MGSDPNNSRFFWDMLCPLELKVDLTVQVERIPDSGLDMVGQLTATELEERLNADGDTGFKLPEGAALELHVAKIENVIRVTGQIGCTVASQCARCLADAVMVLDTKVDMTLFPAADSKSQERADDELEHHYTGLDTTGVTSGVYDGETLDTGDIIRELLLLELPMTPLCKDSCAGLCSSCGQNLNLGPCECSTEDVDPRWQALKEIKVH